MIVRGDSVLVWARLGQWSTSAQYNKSNNVSRLCRGSQPAFFVCSGSVHLNPSRILGCLTLDTSQFTRNNSSASDHQAGPGFVLCPVSKWIQVWFRALNHWLLKGLYLSWYCWYCMFKGRLQARSTWSGDFGSLLNPQIRTQNRPLWLSKLIYSARNLIWTASILMQVSRRRFLI